MKTFRLLTLNSALLLSLLGSHAAQGAFQFGSGANQFSMDFVPIGSPGNLADTTGTPTPAQTGGVGVGAVSYTYQMGKYEVSEDMITKYNAAFGTANSLVITKDTRGANKPATSVSWNEAARFVNWLDTSTGGFAAYKFTTPGVNANIELWTATDTLDFDPANPYRSKRANFVLPSFDEWYKAAYYDPTANGGLGGYWNFPTGSDTAPTAVASGTAAGTAVYSGQAGPADITSAGGLSPFGTMGQGGNAQEWQETANDLVNNSTTEVRGVRGGYWSGSSIILSSSTRSSGLPTGGNNNIGFRVASLSSAAAPEPGSLAVWGLLGLAASLVGWLRLRK